MKTGGLSCEEPKEGNVRIIIGEARDKDLSTFLNKVVSNRGSIASIFAMGELQLRSIRFFPWSKVAFYKGP